jgi:hypothetical protein
VLGAIFGGAEGGPMAAFAPLVGTNLGTKKMPIRYAITGKSRSVEIPGIMNMSVEPVPTIHPSGEVWGALGHPVAPDRLAFAVGRPGSTFADYGMRWTTLARMATTRRSTGRTSSPLEAETVWACHDDPPDGP